MISNKEFRILAGESYQVDAKEIEHPWRKGDIIENNNLTQPYQVIKVEDHTENGMQAMAVTPIKNGKTDTSEIVIAYTGNSFSDKLDLHTDTDFQTIDLRKKCYS